MSERLALHSRSSNFRLPAPERGRLMEAREIAAELCFGKRRPRWVVDHAPKELRVPLGKGYCYWENEMRAWIASLREVA